MNHEFVFPISLAFPPLRQPMDILKKFDEDKEKSSALEDAFKSCRHPDTLTMSLLAADIGATEEDVQVWGKCLIFGRILRKTNPSILITFKNRRTRDITLTSDTF